jgi:hypothetical protein
VLRRARDTRLRRRLLRRARDTRQCVHRLRESHRAIPPRHLRPRAPDAAQREAQRNGAPLIRGPDATTRRSSGARTRIACRSGKHRSRVCAAPRAARVLQRARDTRLRRRVLRRARDTRLRRRLLRRARDTRRRAYCSVPGRRARARAGMRMGRPAQNDTRSGPAATRLTIVCLSCDVAASRSAIRGSGDRHEILRNRGHPR